MGSVTLRKYFPSPQLRIAAAEYNVYDRSNTIACGPFESKSKSPPSIVSDSLDLTKASDGRDPEEDAGPNRSLDPPPPNWDCGRRSRVLSVPGQPGGSVCQRCYDHGRRRECYQCQAIGCLYDMI